MTDAIQEFITENCPEADSILLTEDNKLAFHAGIDPIKNLTKAQKTKLDIITAEETKRHDEEYAAEELRREAEIDAQQKQIYENIENVVDENLSEHFKNQEDTLGPEIHQHVGYSSMGSELTEAELPTIPARRL